MLYLRFDIYPRSKPKRKLPFSLKDEERQSDVTSTSNSSRTFGHKDFSGSSVATDLPSPFDFRIFPFLAPQMQPQRQSSDTNEIKGANKSGMSFPGYPFPPVSVPTSNGEMLMPAMMPYPLLSPLFSVPLSSSASKTDTSDSVKSSQAPATGAPDLSKMNMWGGQRLPLFFYPPYAAGFRMPVASEGTKTEDMELLRCDPTERVPSDTEEEEESKKDGENSQHSSSVSTPVAITAN